uniref:NEP1-interacting protein 1 n=1 Tax=Rhizophora mucronata TaxID=61149 RepID=A0A2P2KQE9_RHIMU
MAPNKVPTKAKKKVKIADRTFPMMAEKAKLQASLTLSTKFPKEGNEEMENRNGHEQISILLGFQS